MSDEPLNLIELRVLARANGYAKIKRNVPGAPAADVHTENSVLAFGGRELARAHLTITRDLTRVMSRLKAIYGVERLLVPASRCRRSVPRFCSFPVDPRPSRSEEWACQQKTEKRRNS